MNVLHLSAVKSWGGGGNHIENLCYELSKTNPEVKNIIVVGEGGQFHERLKTRSYFFDTISLNLKINPKAIFKLIQLCRNEKIDLIHLHGSTSLTLAVLANFFKPLPPFVFSKKTSFPIKQRRQTIYKYNHSKIKKILCVSDFSRRVTAEAVLDSTKLQTVYHGTRIDNKSNQVPFDLRKKLKIPSENRIVGNIGNHIRAKDLRTWVETIDVIVNKLNIKNISFVQIGSFTSFTPEIRELIERFGLNDRVYFLGYLPEASNFIDKFDILLLTSKSEGLPQVIFEAFYHKTPVVSTDVGGIPEIVVHGKNGLLSKAGDSGSLAKNVLTMLTDTEKQKEFTEKGFQVLFPTFTSENMAKETLRIYNSILKDQNQ